MKYLIKIKQNTFAPATQLQYPSVELDPLGSRGAHHSKRAAECTNMGRCPPRSTIGPRSTFRSREPGRPCGRLAAFGWDGPLYWQPSAAARASDVRGSAKKTVNTALIRPPCSAQQQYKGAKRNLLSSHRHRHFSTRPSLSPVAATSIHSRPATNPRGAEWGAVWSSLTRFGGFPSWIAAVGREKREERMNCCVLQE